MTKICFLLARGNKSVARARACSDDDDDDERDACSEFPHLKENQRSSIRELCRYAPLKSTLSTLGKLHGAVDASVFDDFAQLVIAQCVCAVARGAAQLAAPRPGQRSADCFDKELFCIKHLLVLRERIAPFGIRFGTTQTRRLDFSATALTRLTDAKKPKETAVTPRARGVLSFFGGAAELAREGLMPQIAERTLDARRELETELVERL